MKPLSQPDAIVALRWLDDRADECLFCTGYDPAGWESSVWIVHAMYETDGLPSGLSHDDVFRMEQAVGPREPMGIRNLDELMLDERSTLIGSSLGASAWPGPGWHRLRWSELAARLEVNPYELDVPPCFRSFPYDSWPMNIQPPAEGSLDREQFTRFLELLGEQDAGRKGQKTFAYYAQGRSTPFDEQTVFSCGAHELLELYDESERGSPNNLWPEDRSWLVYTDFDLWATKVSGGRELIDCLIADPALETVEFAF